MSPRPNIVIAGEVHVADGYCPEAPDNHEYDITTIPLAVVVQFPDLDSIKAAFRTGRIDCDVFGGPPAEPPAPPRTPRHAKSGWPIQ